MSETLTFQPHARLLTMLGDQLIKNERIALVEIIKNSYDADATRVQIIMREDHIEIVDDGQGMTFEELTRAA